MKERLKRIATEMAQRGGVRAVTLRDLGREVGIKSASVAYHFGSKDNLVYEITEEYVEGIRQRLAAIETDHPTARGRLEALLDLFLEMQSTTEICLCGMLAAEIHDVDERTRTLVRRFFAELEGWVAGVLRGEAPSRIGEEEAIARARTIASTLQGAMLLDKPEPEPSRLAALRALIPSWLG